MQWNVPNDCSWVIKQMMKCRDLVRNDQTWNGNGLQEKFQMRKMYHKLRGEKEKVEWRKLFFHNSVRPRTLFHLWLVFHGRIATKDILHKFGIGTDRNCSFCSCEETIEHLYFECRKTRQIWEEMLNWIGYHRQVQNWKDEKSWIIRETNKKGWRRLILKMAIAETCYWVWRARNDYVFNKKQMDNDIGKTIKYHIVTRGSMQKKINSHLNIDTLIIV